jgi:CheY-like chemotaxis protein
MSEANPVSVLVVEDEALIAMDLQMLLEDAGYRVLGPANSTDSALAILKKEKPDAALLDINLGRSDVFTVANALSTGATRVIFLSGHSAQRLPPDHRHRPLVTKPYLPQVLLQTLGRVLAETPAAG